jgi:hypothetical protein
MRNIPENNLAYPTLIILSTGHSGSGFQLNSGTQLYMVTAKHVLFNEQGQLIADKAEVVCQTSEIDDDSNTVLVIDFLVLQSTNNLFFHPQKDVAAFTFSTVTFNADGITYSTNLIPGVTIKQSGKNGLVSVAKNTVLFLNDVLVSNDIFLYGYPSSLGLKQSPQFVYYGNSGGPVVQVNNSGGRIHHSVVGVVSQFIPYTENWVNQSNKLVHTEVSNSGYSVAVAMDYVFEMLSIKKE